MTISQHPQTVSFPSGSASIARNDRGVVQISATNRKAMFAAIGYCHAVDRGAQMELVRLIAQGRLCECLSDTPTNLMIDRFMRQVGFARTAREEVSEIDSATNDILTAYCEGVAQGRNVRGRHFIFRAMSHKLEPWTAFDSLLVIKIMGYVSLAQNQGDLEKWIVEALTAGCDTTRLAALFDIPESELASNQLAELQGVALAARQIPQEIGWLAPVLRASNGWAISAKKSASGRAMCAADPHLEVNRLPAIWYEYSARVGDHWEMGISVPGLPGMAMGRTQHIASGFTYGYLDMIDYFIEDCADNQVRRADQWVDLQVHEEQILRKKHEPWVERCFESDCGIIELPEGCKEPGSGKFLARSYSAYRSGAAKTLSALVHLTLAKNVGEFCEIVRDIIVSTNWILTDSSDNIAFQQAGRAPLRQGSGLIPLPAWQLENHWRGTVPGDKLLHKLNPECGFLASANEAQNPVDGPRLVNAAGGWYRYQRATALVSELSQATLADFERMQTDLFSPQAAAFMPLFLQALPSGELADALKSWDMRYDQQAQQPVIFEAIYCELFDRIFGDESFGRAGIRHFREDTGLFGTYYGYFDRCILDESRRWLSAQQLHAHVFAAAITTMARFPTLAAVPRWGDVHQLRMNNIFFEGKLPRFLAVDYGPVPTSGGRATLVQSSFYRQAGRQSSFCPSWRMVTDMAQSSMKTILAGGPSEHPRSPWYKTDVEDWLAGRFKEMTPPPISS